MRILALSALALATLATPALAQSDNASADESVSGFKILAIGGLDSVDDGTTRDSGAVYGGSLGYDFQTGHLVIGAEVEGTMASTKDCVGTVCVEAGRDLYAGGRIGFPVAHNTLLYVKGGYTNARINGTVNGNTVTSEDLDGVRAGAGLEADVGRMVVRVEYRYSNYEQDVTRHQGVVGIGIRF